MTDLDIRAIRVSLASAASSAAGVTRALSYVPAKVQQRDLPLVAVGNPELITYNRTFAVGKATLRIPITALVSAAIDPEKATELLDDFVSESLATSAAPASLAAALRRGESSDAFPWTVQVVEADNYGLFQLESTQYFGVQLVVEVRT